MAAGGVYCGHGFAEPLDEALHAVMHTLRLAENSPDALLEATLLAHERRSIADLIIRRVEQRVPMAYLTGTARFAGLDFAVNNNVLIPRSPIAELIEQRFSPWVEESTVASILELGTGSGCIAIACAYAFPDASVMATDISPAALVIARRNVTDHELGDRVTLVEADVYGGLEGRFDLIVSNPPYVDESTLDDVPEEYAHEPRLGLAAGADGMDIVRRIITGAARHLSEHGALVVEVGASQVFAEHAFAHLPLSWIDFERGGDGVFVLERDALVADGIE
jgi:ribosomal protein L3 glutamine methyltransferase